MLSASGLTSDDCIIGDEDGLDIGWLGHMFQVLGIRESKWIGLDQRVWVILRKLRFPHTLKYTYFKGPLIFKVTLAERS